MTYPKADTPSISPPLPPVAPATPKAEENSSGEAQPALENADAPTSRTAAQEFYLCPELRQHLLSLLSKHTLTRVIRVERKIVFDVSKILYRTMDYVWVRAHMTVSTERQRTYCAAVEAIDCRGAKMKVPPAMLKQAGLVISDRKRQVAETASYVAKYNPSLLNLIIPPMRKKCPGLRRMLFGSTDDVEGCTWVVHFDATEATAEDGEEKAKGWGKGKRPKETIPQSGGSIDYRGRLRMKGQKGPPTVITPPSSLSTQYSLDYRFNLIITPPTIRDDAQKWVTALREGDCFGVLSRMISLDQLPFTLDDLAALYRRQIAAGYPDRLEKIEAPGTLPWSFGEFRDFASVASTSLTFLSLHHVYQQGDPLPKASYDDLPTIIEIVRHDLPNLSTFQLALGGSGTAEAVCRAALHERILTDCGTVAELRICSPHSGSILRNRMEASRLFYTILLLSCMCTERARICLDDFVFHRTQNKEQADYLHYLWQQTPQARHHLPKTDFAAIGLERLKELSHIGYHDDGRPMGLWEKKVKELDLQRRVERARSESKPYSTPKLERIWQKCVDAAECTKAIAPSATTLQMFTQVKALWLATREAKSLLEGRNFMSRGWGQADDVRLFVAMLQDLSPDIRAIDKFDYSLDPDSESESESETESEFNSSDEGW